MSRHVLNIRTQRTDSGDTREPAITRTLNKQTPEPKTVGRIACTSGERKTAPYQENGRLRNVTFQGALEHIFI
jgi:hypothetical protein